MIGGVERRRILLRAILFDRGLESGDLPRHELGIQIGRLRDVVAPELVQHDRIRVAPHRVFEVGARLHPFLTLHLDQSQIPTRRAVLLAARHALGDDQVFLGGIEIVLIVFDDSGERVDLRRRSHPLRRLDVGPRRQQLLKQVVVPRAPVVALVDVVELQVDDPCRRLNRLLLALQVGQTNGAAQQRVLVQWLERDRLVVVAEAGLAVADELVEIAVEIGQCRRLRKALGRRGQQLAHLRLLLIRKFAPREEIRGLHKSRDGRRTRARSVRAR